LPEIYNSSSNIVGTHRHQMTKVPTYEVAAAHSSYEPHSMLRDRADRNHACGNSLGFRRPA
jgi:hypothetical protein